MNTTKLFNIRSSSTANLIPSKLEKSILLKGTPTKQKLSDLKYVGVVLNEGSYYYIILRLRWSH